MPRLPTPLAVFPGPWIDGRGWIGVGSSIDNKEEGCLPDEKAAAAVAVADAAVVDAAVADEEEGEEMKCCAKVLSLSLSLLLLLLLLLPTEEENDEAVLLDIVYTTHHGQITQQPKALFCWFANTPNPAALPKRRGWQKGGRGR